MWRPAGKALPEAATAKKIKKIWCGCRRAFESVFISRFGGVPPVSRTSFERGPKPKIAFVFLRGERSAASDDGRPQPVGNAYAMARN
jgi:hypothetical protein